MATTHLLCTGKIVDGDVQWQIAPPLADETPTDGELQRLIDEAEMTAELEDYLLDVEWMRGGF